MAKGGKGGGLGGIADEAKSLAFDLGIPIAMLAAGAGKVSTAWMAFSNIWMRKVLGPMADFTGIAAGAIGAIRKMANSFKEFGMGAASAMESATVRFKPFLKGMESAKQRMAELAKVSAATPFKMEQVVAASQQLENLTRGALSTGKGLEMVGDIAAMTGRDFETTAYWVGRLYDAVQSGRPIGEATMRLQEMGAVSGTTRNQLESLTESGAASNEVWKIAEKEFSRASGSMKDMSKTLDGLQSTLNDNKNLMGAAFASGYLEGDKAMVEATANAYEKFTPIVKELGDQLGGVSNFFSRMTAGLTNLASGMASVLQPAISAVTGVLTVFLTAIQLATVTAIGKWVISMAVGKKSTDSFASGISKMMEGFKQGLSAGKMEKDLAGMVTRLGAAETAFKEMSAAGADAGDLDKAEKRLQTQRNQVADQRKLVDETRKAQQDLHAAGKGEVKSSGVGKAFTEGRAAAELKAQANDQKKKAQLMAEGARLKAQEARQSYKADGAASPQFQALAKDAVAMRDMVAAEKVAAAATATRAKAMADSAANSFKLTGGTGVLRAAVTGLGKAAQLAGGLLKTMFASLLADPLFLVAAAFVGVAMAIKTMNDRYAAARKAVDDFNQATREQSSLMKQQLANVRSASDLAALYADNSRKLAEARMMLAEAEAKEAANPGTKSVQDGTDAARKRVQTHEDIQKRANKIKASDLAPGEVELSGDKILRKRQDDERTFQTSLETMSPEQRASALKDRADKAATGGAAASQREKDREARRIQSSQSQAAASDMASRQAQAQSALEMAKGRVAKAGIGVTDERGDTYVNPEEMNRARAALMEAQNMVDSLAASAKKATDPMEELMKIMGGSDAIEKLQTQITLLNNYKAAEMDILNTVTKIDELREKRRSQSGKEAAATSQEIDTLKKDLESQKKTFAAQEANLPKARLSATSVGADLIQKTSQKDALIAIEKDQRDRAAALKDEADRAARDVTERNRLAGYDIERADIDARPEGMEKKRALFEQQRKEIDATPNLTDKEKEARKAEVGTAEANAEREDAYSTKFASLDIDAAALELQDEGLAKALAMVEVEKQRLALKAQETQMNEKVREAEEARLKAMEDGLKRQADLLQKRAALETAADRAGRDMARGLASGNVNDVADAKRRKQAAEDKMASNDLKDQARQQFSDPKKQQAFHDEQMKAREEDRKKDEAAFAAKERRQAKINTMARRADILEAGGSTQQAKALRERQAKMEATDRARQRASDLVAGGMSQKEAVKLAKKERSQEGRARRAGNRASEGVWDMRQFPDLRMTANSLARIGGGGGAVGAGSYAGQILKKMDTMIGIQRGTGAAMAGKMRMK